MAYKSSLGANDSIKKSKLGYVRHNGSSKSGTKAWVFTRWLFVISLILSIYVVASLLLGHANSYGAFKNWLYNPFNFTILGLFIVTFMWYGFLEMAEIITDYIHHDGTKLIAKFLLVVCTGFVAILSIVSMLFAVV